MMVRVEDVDAGQPRKELPPFRPGDTVRVEVQVVEGDKRRVQAFQGTVMQRRGSGPRETFTVRKVSGGVGVERIFPAHAPGILNITVVQRGRVRRAKLNYLRQRKGKSAQVKRRQDRVPSQQKTKRTQPEPDVMEMAPAGVAEDRGGEA